MSGERSHVLCGGMASMVIASASVVRGLWLYLAARPGTPLRALCIMAFDTLHALRHGRRLPMHALRMMAAFLDFGACANAALDNKPCCRQACRVGLHLVEDAGRRASFARYFQRLAEIEGGRPSPGGDRERFERVREYREAVVRLSLGMLSATAAGNSCLDEAIAETWRDAGLNLLFRIAMQCQVIDDVVDYSKDLSARLPSFLTATRNLAEGLELTRQAASDYAGDRDVPRSGELLTLRSALFLVSACARLAIWLSRWMNVAPSAT